MAAYVVVEATVTDAEQYQTYRALAERSLAEMGGRYLARGGATEVLEGTWEPTRVVVVEFDDLAAARAWYGGDGYREAREARRGAATMNMILVDGVDDELTPSLRAGEGHQSTLRPQRSINTFPIAPPSTASCASAVATRGKCTAGSSLNAEARSALVTSPIAAATAADPIV